MTKNSLYETTVKDAAYSENRSYKFPCFTLIQEVDFPVKHQHPI